jgi:hypothetical protein
MGFAGYVSVCVQLYCVGFHCFTTCFGLHGHLRVYRIFYVHVLEGTKKTEEKAQMETCRAQPCEKKRQFLVRIINWPADLREG